MSYTAYGQLNVNFQNCTVVPSTASEKLVKKFTFFMMKIRVMSYLLTVSCLSHNTGEYSVLYICL